MTLVESASRLITFPFTTRRERQETNEGKPIAPTEETLFFEDTGGKLGRVTLIGDDGAILEKWQLKQLQTYERENNLYPSDVAKRPDGSYLVKLR
jgi:hypothetical protein